MPGLVLRAEAGPLAGTDLPWGADGVVGRDAACELPLKDAGVSRRHARILRDGDGWAVEDLGSRNGTFVNGQKVQGRRRLAAGDRIQVGAAVLRCLPGGEAPEPEAADDAPITEVLRRQSLDFLKAAPDDPAELARSRERLVALLDFARRAAEAESLEAVWELAGPALAAALGADRALVLRPVGRAGAWEPYRAPAAGLDAALAKVPVSATVVRHVREKGEGVLSQAPRSDARFGESGSLAAAGVSSVLCAPVLHGTEPLGALYADRLGKAKPFVRADLELAVGFALSAAGPWDRSRREARLQAGRASLERESGIRHDLVGASPALARLKELTARAAASDAAVLVTGESGAGKELVARGIHRQGPRARGPFEAVNCAALTETLFESELFGHAKGAFTGADEDKPGRFELADGGTLFLDEVGDLPASCQTKLLRVLEDGQVRRVGDVRDRPVDVRLVAATNRALEGEGTGFRQDLFYRLNVVRIEVPPLRDRREDIPLLAEHFARRFAAESHKAPKRLSPALLALLAEHRWPGNIRELRNCIERMVVLSDGAELGPEDLPEGIRAGAGGAGAARALSGDAALVPLEEVEKAHVLRVLSALEGNKKRAAEVLGIDRGTLYAKLKRYGLET